jgi:hypothetical protein
MENQVKIFIFSYLFFQHDKVHLSIIYQLFSQGFNNLSLIFSTNDTFTFKQYLLFLYYRIRLFCFRFNHLFYAFLSFCYKDRIKIQKYRFYSLLSENLILGMIIAVITFSSIVVF